MRVVAASDWVIDIGPGAGEKGGRVVAAGTPAELSKAPQSRTAPYLASFLQRVGEKVSATDGAAARIA
jgi:excinuclease ABC subunit A